MESRLEPDTNQLTEDHGENGRGMITVLANQSQSLFFELPSELRQIIYHYTLASYEDISRQWGEHSYYRYPLGGMAPQKSDTALLRSCKRVYYEARSVLWASTCKDIWVVLDCPSTFLNALESIYSREGHIEIGCVRFMTDPVFTSPYFAMSRYLDLPYFHPKQITFVLRHHGARTWDHSSIDLDRRWVNMYKLPASVHHVKMEIENLEHMQEVVDSAVAQMTRTWYFTRSDGVCLTARRTKVTVTKWKGSSILDDWLGQKRRRWCRDEVEPEVLAYYIATVTFRHEPGIAINDMPKPDTILSKLPAEKKPGNPLTVSAWELEAAGVAPKTPARVAWRMCMELRMRRQRMAAQSTPVAV